MGKALLKGHKTALSAVGFGSFLTTGIERMQQCVRVGLYFKQIVPFLVSAVEGAMQLDADRETQVPVPAPGLHLMRN